MTSRLHRRLRILALAASLSFAPGSPASTLFEDIGGEQKLRSVIEELATVILADERINFTFAGIDLAKFKASIYNQLCELASGPCIYDGRDMHTAHSKLPITDAQFNALAEDLYIAFDRAGVNYRTQNRMMALLAPMRRDIVKR